MLKLRRVYVLTEYLDNRLVGVYTTRKLARKALDQCLDGRTAQRIAFTPPASSLPRLSRPGSRQTWFTDNGWFFTIETTILIEDMEK